MWTSAGLQKDPLIERLAGLLLPEPIFWAVAALPSTRLAVDHLFDGNQVVGSVVPVLPMLPPIPSGWRSLLRAETRKPYYRAMDAFLEKARAGGQTTLSARKDIFNPLASTS